MKIKKFNESTTDKIDEKYLSFIFSDFIDNDAEVVVDEMESGKNWHIFLEEPMISNKFETFDDYTKNIEEIYNFSKELESCFKRIDDDFPDAIYDIVIEEIIDEKGTYILSRDVEHMSDKIRRILIICFEL